MDVYSVTITLGVPNQLAFAAMKVPPSFEGFSPERLIIICIMSIVAIINNSVSFLTAHGRLCCSHELYKKQWMLAQLSFRTSNIAILTLTLSMMSPQPRSSKTISAKFTLHNAVLERRDVMLSGEAFTHGSAARRRHNLQISGRSRHRHANSQTSRHPSLKSRFVARCFIIRLLPDGCDK